MLVINGSVAAAAAAAAVAGATAAAPSAAEEAAAAAAGLVAQGGGGGVIIVHVCFLDLLHTLAHNLPCLKVGAILLQIDTLRMSQIHGVVIFGGREISKPKL